MVERVRIETPQPCPPLLLVKYLSKLIKALPSFDRVSVGFPGVVRDGIVLTAPNLTMQNGLISLWQRRWKRNGENRSAF